MPTFQEKLLALVSLTLVSTAIGYFMKVSGVKGKYNYSPMSAVCMTEAFKLTVSTAIIGRLIHAQTLEAKGGDCAKETERFAEENYSWKVGVHNAGLALAYAVVNLVTFGVFAHAPASTFFLLKAASPVITALMLAILVKRPISGQQWASIMMQCVGLAATQIDPCSLKLSLSPLAYIYLIINIAVSCGAGVWNEHIVKTFNVSVNAQNSMMYSWGVAINLVLFFMLPATTVGGKADTGFFEGYNWTVMGVIAANGSVGLVITAVYKYADVVVKTFGLAGSTVTLFILEVLGVLPAANAGPPRMAAVFGAVIVFYASYVYIAPPLMEQVPAAELADRQELANAEEGQSEKPAERPVPLGRNPRIFILGLLFVAVGLTASFGAQQCQ
eukprot:CAMPEP_0174834128 /NCGR_PEP_ID=MMETSP1114-20130205/4647_1 /TAXON_ID=312471 /ORGANISM="Neobodo designis, Strain CCAP 1951/1" /LENGTH=385 /DNA_ID=CAMNT_0016068031 /DNA_START=229 /DNA_END=1386 /DNA_ORIENTATION=-